MISPIYQDTGFDPFEPCNVSPDMARAVTRSDCAFGPMPGTDQLDSMRLEALGRDALATYAKGRERLWWSPYRGTIYSSRNGGTILSTHLGGVGHRATRIERAAAIHDITLGLAGLRRWAGRGKLDVCRHSLLMAAMGADGAAAVGTKPGEGVFETACFMAQHDFDEAFGHGDPASPIGRLFEGLVLEHRKRATAAAFWLVRPCPESLITDEFLEWASAIDHEAAALEYAWDFRHIPFWIEPGTRAHTLASAILGALTFCDGDSPAKALTVAVHNRSDRRELAGDTDRAQAMLYNLTANAIVEGAPARNSLLSELHNWTRADAFAKLALDVWREIGPLPRPAVAPPA